MDTLIQQAKQGDQIAIEQIVADYKGLLRSLANKFYLVGGDKDDLLQEGMIGLFHAIQDFNDQKGSFPAFVKLCVGRQLVDAVKRDNAYKNRPLLNYVEISFAEHLTDESNPLEELLQKEQAEKIALVIKQKLTPLERKVCTLFSEGYTYEDISTQLNTTYKAVDGALQRARKKLLSTKE